ncbi:MAG: CDP-diacylglycerol--glycerol-3-phosphate 3-phosphatidyltransferase [Thermoleophilia bacterium]
MNAANAITLTRILLIPVFIAVLFVKVPHGDILAAALFTVAAFTDKLDGYVARRQDTVTALGQFLDPLADKLLVAAALIALVGLGHLDAWVAMVIIAREIAVSVLRIVGAVQGISMPADRLGKAKTASQVAAIIFLLIPHHGLPGYVAIETVLVWLAVILTLVSGIHYFVKARDLLRLPGSNAKPASDQSRPSSAVDSPALPDDNAGSKPAEGSKP